MWPELRIVRARLARVALPLRTPFRISGGVMTRRRSIVVTLEDASGAEGFGESAPFDLPFYSPETIDSATACLHDVLLPRVVGSTIRSPAELHRALGDGIRGNRMARAGVETACWDLASRRREVSLVRLVQERLTELGLTAADVAARDRVPCGIALGIPESREPAALGAAAAAAVRRGFRRVKLKIQPGWSTEPVRAVMDGVASAAAGVPVWADGNGAFDRRADSAELAALDTMGMVFLEQPFAEECLWDATVWNRTARTSICLDESLVSEEAARQIVEMNGPLIWNLKVQRLGGLEPTCRVYACGVRAGARMWVGTMPESGLGAQSGLAVAALSRCSVSTDLEPSDRWYLPGEDLIDLTMDAAGYMTVPSAPGAVPPPDRLTEFAVIA